MNQIKWKKDATVQINRFFSKVENYYFVIDIDKDCVELTAFSFKNKEKLFLGGRHFINETDAKDYVNDLHTLNEESIIKRLIKLS